MSDPKNNIDGLTNRVEKYLEEASLEALCLMADTYTFDEDACKTIREDAGLEEGTSSYCWKEFYLDLPSSFELIFHEGAPNGCNYDAGHQCDATVDPIDTSVTYKHFSIGDI